MGEEGYIQCRYGEISSVSSWRDTLLSKNPLHAIKLRPPMKMVKEMGHCKYMEPDDQRRKRRMNRLHEARFTYVGACSRSKPSIKLCTIKFYMTLEQQATHVQTTSCWKHNQHHHELSPNLSSAVFTPMLRRFLPGTRRTTHFSNLHSSSPPSADLKTPHHYVSFFLPIMFAPSSQPPVRFLMPVRREVTPNGKIRDYFVFNNRLDGE